MNMKPLEFGELLRHPVTLAVGGFSAATALLQIKVLSIVALYFWGHIGEVFTIFSLAGFTIAPNVDFVPQEPLMVLAILAAVAWGAKKIIGMFRDLDQKLDS